MSTALDIDKNMVADANSVINRIAAFNVMYGLPTPTSPHGFSPKELEERLVRFKQILTDEVNEVDEIVTALKQGADPLVVLTMLGDWLGDCIVYVASEARRHGLPLVPILDVIMDSNESKLGEDGKPIVRDGKVVKGPNYWKPEPKIMKVIHQTR